MGWCASTQSAAAKPPGTDGECLGTLSKKRSIAMVSMSSVSQYRTNTEKARMAELGQERNVQVLWLLTLTAPEASWAKVEPTFEGIAASFKVPLKPNVPAS